MDIGEARKRMDEASAAVRAAEGVLVAAQESLNDARSRYAICKAEWSKLMAAQERERILIWAISKEGVREGILVEEKDGFRAGMLRAGVIYPLVVESGLVRLVTRGQHTSYMGHARHQTSDGAIWVDVPVGATR
jgi:hypothetical protein